VLKYRAVGAIHVIDISTF